MTDSSSRSQELQQFFCRRRRYSAALGVLLAILLLAAVLWRIALGDWRIPLRRVISVLSPNLAASEAAAADALVVRAVRLPRVLSSVGAGGALAVCGAVLQGLLANALAEPYTLGIASGAALGAALAFFFGSFGTAAMAFGGALGALALVLLISRRAGGGCAHLVLAGIITNAVLSSGVTLLKALADDRLSAIVLWLMGSFSGASPLSALSVWIGAAAIFMSAWFCGPALDAVSLGEDQGSRLGIDEKKLRLGLLCVCSFSVALTVSSFGVIGFVGLVVPHMLRFLIGPAHRQLIFFSFLAGGTLLTAADGVAQLLGELPVGVITALAGGPFFCWILMRTSR